MKKIQILGTGCPKCQKLAHAAEAAARELGLEFELEKVTNIDDIMKFGVMMTPALAVDGAIKVVGRVPAIQELVKILAPKGLMMTGNVQIKAMRALMLCYVGVSLIWVFAKDVASQSPVSLSGEAVDLPGSAPEFTLYYFHGNIRCKTCLMLENLARQSAAESLAVEIGSGRLAFKVVNFDEMANRHFIDDFELPGSQMVIAQTTNEAPGAYQQLQDVWYLSDDPAGFQKYVSGTVRTFMSDGGMPHE